MAFNNIFDSSLVDYSKDFEYNDKVYKLDNWIDWYNNNCLHSWDAEKISKENIQLNSDDTLTISNSIIIINSQYFEKFPYKIKELNNSYLLIEKTRIRDLETFPDFCINAGITISDNPELTSLKGFPKVFKIDKWNKDNIFKSIIIRGNYNLNMGDSEIIRYIKDNSQLDNYYNNRLIDENNWISHNYLN